MADKTLIEWTGATWSPITGCSIKSPGCLHCYAMNLAATRLQHHPSRAGLTKQTKAGPVWTGEVRFNEQWLDQPLRWKTPKDIFVVAHGDLFHENVPDEWIDRVFAVMALAPQHRFQVLTKRTERMREYFAKPDPVIGILNAMWKLTDGEPALISIPEWPLPNVWPGTSVERQPEADERRPHLAALAAAGWNTWVSYEPALGPVDWTGWEFIRWFVGGGESGPKARPSHPHWHYAARDFCVAHDVPYFFKQWGAWLPWLYFNDADVGDDLEQSRFPAIIWDDEEQRFDEHMGGWMDDPGASNMSEPDQIMGRVGKKAAGHLLDGVEWRQFPGAAR